MKTMLITGGRGDLGQAIIKKFTGFRVIAPTRAELNLLELHHIADFVQQLPEVDAFIHCAGINEPKPFVEITPEDITKTITVHALAFYTLVQELVKQKKMQENGHILGLSSVYGEVSRPGRFSYTAAKSCLNGMIKNLALELGALKIKVNGLAPGFIDTQLTRRNNSPETLHTLAQSVPLGHLGHVDDIAKVAYFLASDENQYISGQTIIADGGYLAGGFQK